MPRPFRTRASASCLATALCCAVLGPSALHAALAAAAGSLFEAAPFVLVAEALPKKHGLRALSVLAGCGCGADIPGALSLAAIGLCWLTFGPAVALLRTAAGAALFIGTRPRDPRGRLEPVDALSQLLALAPGAALAAVCSSAVASHARGLSAAPVAEFAAFGIGLALGALAPCGTAAVAIAAALWPHLPFAAAGILTTGGLVPRIALYGGGRREGARGGGAGGNAGPGGEHTHEKGGACYGEHAARSRRVCVARMALGLVLATFALGGPRGFVNPRLVPFEGLAAALAFAGIRRSPGTGDAFVVPAILFVALAAGSPEPSYLANETRLDDAFAGERVAFTGVAHRHGKETIVQRFSITCCRVDASAIAVRIAETLPVADGSWLRVTGVLIDAPSGLLLRPNAWHKIAPPLDPFVYR